MSKKMTLREILEDILKGFWTTPMKDLQIKWMGKALSAIENHYKARRLSERDIEQFIFTFLYKRKLSETYRHKCRCVDGCADCDGTGYILNKLGIALIDLAHAIFKAQEEKDGRRK